jgi:hypothetical protein
MRDGMIEIRLPRCRLVLTRGELFYLLSQDRELWQRALERGKAALRRERMEARCREAVPDEGDPARP